MVCCSVDDGELKESKGTWRRDELNEVMVFIAGKRGHRCSGDGGGSSDDDAGLTYSRSDGGDSEEG